MRVTLAVNHSERGSSDAELEVEVLTFTRRLTRGLFRGALVAAAGAVVLLLPLLHLCGALGLVLGAPVTAWLMFQTSVLTVGVQRVACPRCHAAVEVESGRNGWPVRLHCAACGVGFGARPAPFP